MPDKAIHNTQSEGKRQGGTLGVIPARYESSRFPGKPLADILGTPMVVRVYRRAAASGLDRVMVATDDERIAGACAEHGVPVVMTSPYHRTGSDRVAEVARDGEYDIVINIQGDEPLIQPALIDALIEDLNEHPDSDIATACRPITDAEELGDQKVVKVTAATNGRAINFSRRPIPYSDERDLGRLEYCKHIGIYAYRRKALERFSSLPSSRREIKESLEQLRALEHDMCIKVLRTNSQSISVDCPEDMKQLIEGMREMEKDENGQSR